MKKIINQTEIKFPALSQNEGFARTAAASFVLQLNPTIDEITDIKTAVSEAVTNCVVHAYPKKQGEVVLKIALEENSVHISVTDFGIGIEDFAKAREPFFTTKPGEERSGMGFTVMESFMDSINLVKNTNNQGVTVEMVKHIGQAKQKAVNER